MQHAAGRRLLLSVIALGGLVLALVSTSALVLGESRGAAWCYDGNRWLGYAEGIPGSATQEDFSNCLRAAADRGEIVALEGVLQERGALIQAGDGSIYWEFEVRRETSLAITAYDDHVAFGDTCDRRIQLQNGFLTTSAPGYPCSGRQRIERTDRRVFNPDFTIYVVGRQFVAVGEDGWYHVHLDQTGWGENETPRSQITLTNRWPGIWITTARDHPGPSGGQIFFIRQPLVGNHSQLQYYLSTDWETRVPAEATSASFSRAGYDFLPDHHAYWALIKEATDAIIEDLFHGRHDRPALVLEALESGLIYADHSRYFTTHANTWDLLHKIARVIAGPNAGYGGTFTGTLLMLWDRYVPTFDREAALALAHRYGVAVGDHPPVNPVSELTAKVNEILFRLPPPLPSDYEPIDPDDLHLSVTLELGKTYDHWSDVLIVTSELVPSCVVEESYSDGTTYRLRHGPQGKFTVNPGGTWNGINLLGFSGGPGVSGMYVRGTPTLVGRVRVEITTKCPGGYAQEPRFAGYSEIIVVDPGAEEE